MVIKTVDLVSELVHAHHTAGCIAGYGVYAPVVEQCREIEKHAGCYTSLFGHTKRVEGSPPVVRSLHNVLYQSVELMAERSYGS